MVEEVSFDIDGDGNVIDTSGVRIISGQDKNIEIQFFDETISIDEIDLPKIITISESELSRISTDIEKLIHINPSNDKDISSLLTQIGEEIANLKKLLLQIPNIPESIKSKIRNLISILEARLKKTIEDKQSHQTQQQAIGTETVTIDIEPDEIPEITTLGTENPTYYKHKYKIKIDANALEKIIFHSKAEAPGGETGGSLVGRFDSSSNTIHIIDFIPLPSNADRGPVHVQFTQSDFGDHNRIIDKWNMENPYDQRIMVGWFHSHPKLEAFLSDSDRNVHTTFTGDTHIAIVYDPIREQFFTWQDISHLSPSEIKKYEQLGSVLVVDNPDANKRRVLGVTPSIQIVGSQSSRLKTVVNKLKVARIYL